MNIWSSERVLFVPVAINGIGESGKSFRGAESARIKLKTRVWFDVSPGFVFFLSVGTECNYGVGTTAMISDLEGNVTAQSNAIRCRAEVPDASAPSNVPGILNCNFFARRAQTEFRFQGVFPKPLSSASLRV